MLVLQGIVGEMYSSEQSGGEGANAIREGMGRYGEKLRK